MTRTTTTIGRHRAASSRTRSIPGRRAARPGRPRKDLPCKYLYDERGSALFDEICELDEYYLTRTELAILACATSREMAEAIGPDCELIELGSGSGLKTRLLLEHLREPRAYFPVDISRRAALAVGRRAGRALPRARDHPGLRRLHRRRSSLPETGTAPARRVVYFPGSTIGNFRPTAAQRLLRSIARLVGAGGGLLIGFDLDKDESIVWPAYNDRRGISAAFNLNLLARINRELGCRLRPRRLRAPGRLLRARGTRRDLTGQPDASRSCGSPGADFAFDAGEPIHTEDSYKYTRGALRPADRPRRLLARAAMVIDESVFLRPVPDGRLIRAAVPGHEEPLGEVERPLDGQGQHGRGDRAFEQDHRGRRRGGCR